MQAVNGDIIDWENQNYYEQEAKVVVFGDSHSCIWKRVCGIEPSSPIKIDYLPRVEFVGKAIMSASAQGLINKDSKTNSGALFREHFDKMRGKYDFVIFQFGNVDVDFILWHTKRDIDEQIEISSRGITDYINETFKDVPREKIIIVGIQPPTISDKYLHKIPGCSLNQKERTEISLRLNERLKEKTRDNTNIFLDVFPYLLDENVGIIKQKYVSNEQDNHSNDKSAAIYAEKLKTILKLQDKISERKSYPRDANFGDKLGGPMEPWINRKAIDFLEKYLKKDMTIAEFGSGSSTRWFANRVKKLVSIENSERWYEVVKEDIRYYNNIDYLLVELICNQGPPYQVIDNEKKRETYVNILNSEYQGELFDAIIIDGRLRNKSIIASHLKLKDGGLLLLDNSDRAFYRDACDLIDSLGYKKTVDNNGVNQTTWWIK